MPFPFCRSSWDIANADRHRFYDIVKYFPIVNCLQRNDSHKQNERQYFFSN